MHYTSHDSMTLCEHCASSWDIMSKVGNVTLPKSTAKKIRFLMSQRLNYPHKLITRKDIREHVVKIAAKENAVQKNKIFLIHAETYCFLK